MATAYINCGPEEGNLYMENFDITVEKINDEVDKFIDLSNENIKTSIENINSSIRTTITLILLSIIFLLITSILTWMFVTKNIVTPLTTILSKLKSIANNEGDLTQNIDFISNDEIGELAENFNLMQDSFRKIVKIIIEESNNVENKVIKTNENISHLAMLIDDIYSTTEELSGGMEETQPLQQKKCV